MTKAIRVFIAWFGMLTPVFAAGALTVLLLYGMADGYLIGRIVVVSIVNFYIGNFLYRSRVPTKTKSEPKSKYVR